MRSKTGRLILMVGLVSFSIQVPFYDEVFSLLEPVTNFKLRFILGIENLWYCWYSMIDFSKGHQICLENTQYIKHEKINPEIGGKTG